MVARSLMLAALVCGWAIGSLSAVGCATTPLGPGESDGPLPLEDELVNAARVAAEQPHLVVRYNPAQCTCPEFEIQLGARWVRLEIEGVDSPDSPAFRLNVRAKRDLESGAIRHYTVKGDLGGSPRRCAQGALFLTLAVASEME